MQKNKRGKILKTRSNNLTKLSIIIIINIIIFGITNIAFDLKYEQVDDFIIYNLYSGLDGTNNIHGIYIHPILCIILSTLFKLIYTINWHSIFLLSMQFTCFTVIGYLLLKKYNNKISLILYTIFASIFYTTLLLLIQYTSVAALLILTAFFIIINILEQQENKKIYIVIYTLLYTLGIMLRIQSLLIVIPFFAIYGLYYFIMWIKKTYNSEKLFKLIKIYINIALITVIIYITNSFFYQNNENYEEFLEYNNLRTILHDKNTYNYERDKEICEQIGWSENDYFLFRTFNIGDEIVFSKENLQKIVDYKVETNGHYYEFELDIVLLLEKLFIQTITDNTWISAIFIAVAILALSTNKEKRNINIAIIIATIGLNLLFLIMNREVLRVVMPGYILGTLLLINNFKIVEKDESNIKIEKMSILVLLMIILIQINFVGRTYNYSYELDEYSNYKELINYTNQHKENVYLYTVPALQFRYVAYSVYEMPPQASFSNLRVMGGWDIYTENYYNFKEQYNLNGTFLDLLKDNAYLINGEVQWNGRNNKDYIDKIVLFLKEHYDIEVTYEKVKKFDNLTIYKLKSSK